MPQHRSASTPASANRAWRCWATTSAEACSRPARVKNMSMARLNFARAASRSSCWARAAATSPAGYVSRSRVPRASAVPGVRA